MERLSIKASIIPSQIKNYQNSIKDVQQEKEAYALFVGTLEPGKDLKTLIKAMTFLKDSSLQLKIVGAKGWRQSQLPQLLKENGLEEKVVFTGFVSAEELTTLYKNASLFILPSLYEGFGLPIVEAMKSGTAVLTSQNSAMSEVAGGAARLVSALDVEDILEALLQLSTDDIYVSGLVGKGLERSEAFSWQQCAEETLAVYHGALGGSQTI